jgi:hypothetical protein
MSLKQNDELQEIIKDLVSDVGGTDYDFELYGSRAIKKLKEINEVTHHPSGWKYCEECKKLKEEQKYGE